MVLKLHPCQKIPDPDNEYWVETGNGLWKVKAKPNKLFSVRMWMLKLKEKSES